MMHDEDEDDDVQSTLARCIVTFQVQRSSWYDRTGRPGQTANQGIGCRP